MNYDRNSIADMLSLADFSAYYRAANDVRLQNVGDEIQIRALLEFSNYCRRNCSYCGLNCTNRDIKRFRLTKDEIVALAYEAFDANYKTIVLQSGEDKHFTTRILGDIVGEIKKKDIKVTLSCGEMSLDDYKYLRNCGADRYLLKHETSDPVIYAALHDGCTLENRLDCLRFIKQVGMETGGGFMVGLPNQTMLTIADDLLLLRELGCDMAGIGPFIPHEKTKLSSVPHGSVELTKRSVSIARLLMPKAHLPATTSLGVIEIDAKRSVFDCGANVIMQKITPNNVKRLYQIYPSNLTDFTVAQGRKNVEQEIISLGRNPY